MIKLLSIFIIAFTSLGSFAQSGKDHKPITSENWEKLAELKYVKDKSGQWLPVFSKNIHNMEGQEIELTGYMVPFDYGIKFKTFGLSVLPLAQCSFCGTGDIPKIVEVQLLKSYFFVETPIKVKGILQLNDSDREHFEFILQQAKVVD